MKLYTKENFLKAAEFCEVSMIDARYIISRIDEVTDPIELPSDEEIEEYVDSEGYWGGWSPQYFEGIIEGAKWMRDKIKGGNKKNHNPIEIPSDEEIHEMGKDVIIYNDTKRGWFIEGLKFMRDKIQGGNK